MDGGLTMHRILNIGLFLCAALSLSNCDSSVKKDIRNLGHKRAGVRLHAIESLSRNRDQRSIEALNRALNDPDTRVRLKAIDVLGTIQDPSSVDPLLSKIDDRERIVGLAAIEALGALKDSRATGPISKLLTKTDPNLRMTAVSALGDIGSVGCVEILSGCLNDENRFVRAAAILALKNVGDPSVIDPLTQALVREVQDNALGSLIVYVLDNLDPDWEKDESTDQAILNLISEFKDEKLTETKRRSIAATFARINRHWTDEDWADSLKGEFLESLNDENPLVREAAAQGLGELRDERMFGPLSRALTDEPDWSVRCDILYALGEIKDKRAVGMLCRSLKDSIPSVRFSAAAALGRIGDTTAVNALIAALDDATVSDVGAFSEIVIESPRDVRIAIAQALGELEDARSANALVRLMSSRSCFVRRAGTAALRRIGDRGSLEPLIAALNDPSIDVRREAAMALGKIGDKRAFQAMLDAVRSKRLRVTDVSRSLDMLDPNWRDTESTGNLVEDIQRQFHDMDLGTRIRAAEDLAEIANDQASETLINELRKRNRPIVAGAHRFYIKRNIRGYEPVLVDALRFYGDKNVATIFLKSRNDRLAEAARNWARSRNLSFLSWPIKEGLIQ